MTAPMVVLAILIAVCIVGFLSTAQSGSNPIPWLLGMALGFAGLAVCVSTLN